MTVTPTGSGGGAVVTWPALVEEPFSPRWWTQRLHTRLTARLASIELCEDYYRGLHRLPWLAPQVAESFRRILDMTMSNYMGLVVDAYVERLEVLGFRVGDSAEGDSKAWDIWQVNNLDAAVGDGFLQAGKSGTSYLLLAPADERRGQTLPRITLEHPSQVIVESDPSDLKIRDAGLKVWTDDRVGLVLATLYLPDAIYKWQGKTGQGPAAWEPRLVEGESWPAENPLGVVPIIELPNNPQWIYDADGLRFEGVSEIADVIGVQDRINKTIADRLMTQDFGAFPQKWANNWDNDSDQPEYGGSLPVVGPGDPVVAPERPAVDFGRDRMITASGPTKFGQFDAAPLDPYSTAKTEDVKDIASRTRTPSQYLLGDLVNISADALHAAESGLVSKVKQRQRPFAEALEEIMRLALALSGDDRPGVKGMETIWRDPEYRSIGALVDAVVKKIQVGLIPIRQGREDAGYSQRQIARMEAEDRKAALQAAVAAQLAQPVPPTPTDPGAGSGQTDPGLAPLDVNSKPPQE